MTSEVKGDELERTPQGFFRTRLRYGKGSRGRFVIRLKDENAAKARAVRLRALAEMLGAAGHSAEAPVILKKAGAMVGEADFAAVVLFAEQLCATSPKAQSALQKRAITFRELAESWTSGDLTRDWPDYVEAKRSVGHDISRLEFLYKAIGAVPLAKFELTDAERAMRSLDPKLSSATRRQYAQLISRVLKLAVYPCKLIDRSPLPKGFLPKVKGKKATAYLYPEEDAKLLASKKVALERRVLYGFLAREGMRFGEATTMRWRDLDLKRGVVTLDRNKTNNPRSWVLGPGVKEALLAFKPNEVSEDAAVFAVDDPTRAADQLIDDLRASEATDRVELFETTKTRIRMRAHDLRGTFVTLSLANGKSEKWVRQRTGHKSSIMLARYDHEVAGELKLGELLPLNEAIPELAPVPPASDVAGQGGPEGGPEQQPPAAIPTTETTESSMIPSGGPSRTRTGIPLLERDFKSPASAIPPRGHIAPGAIWPGDSTDARAPAPKSEPLRTGRRASGAQRRSASAQVPVSAKSGENARPSKRSVSARSRNTPDSTSKLSNRSAPANESSSGPSQIARAVPVKDSTSPVAKSAHTMPARGLTSRLPKVLKMKFPRKSGIVSRVALGPSLTRTNPGRPPR